MTRIAQEDLATSIAQALQLASYRHPPDFVRAMRQAHASPTAHREAETAKAHRG